MANTTSTVYAQINIDTVSAISFISESSTVRHLLKAVVSGKQMVMTQTAVDEFKNVLKVAGPIEQARAINFLNRVNIIADDPSVRALGLVLTKKVGSNDKLIFGTGDKLGIQTVTADRRFVSGALAQGVDFDVFLHDPVALTGS